MRPEFIAAIIDWCVQLMLHVLFFKKKIDRIDFENQMRIRKDGTHGHAIFLIGLDLIKIDRSSYKNFQAQILKLKEHRERSDYYDVAISQSIGLDAYQKTETIINILNKNFI